MRLATFNVLHGRAPSDGQVNVDRFAGAIRDLDADVLALQEVDRDQPRSLGADLTAVAAEAMGAREHRFVAALAGSPGSWQAATGEEQPGTAGYGIALLSRYPVTDWQVLRLPPLPVRAPVWPEWRRLRLVRDEARVAVSATVQAPCGELLVIGTHLSFLRGWNVVQLRRVMRAVGTRSGPAVVMGDLNMGPRVVRAVTGLDALVSQATFPAEHPSRQIDHIVGRGLPRAVHGEALAMPLSDHQALVADLDGREDDACS